MTAIVWFGSGFTNAEKKPERTKNGGAESKSLESPTAFLFQDTYFEFIGDPGEEDDPTKWIVSADGSGCPLGETQACKVLIRASYLLPTSPLTINPALLPGGRMPVINTEDDFHVPDPAGAGTGATGEPYASTSEIYNKSVETTLKK